MLRTTVTTLLMVILLILLVPTVGQGRNVTVPLIKTWTSRTHLFLSQCMVAEADESKLDHIAIAYASRNWWLLLTKKYPKLRYIDVISSYCSVHKLEPQRLSKRQRWIRQLDFPQRINGNLIFHKPTDFPDNASWDRKKQKWQETLQLAYDWNLGKYKDPCNGKAVHWGAPQDPKNKNYLPEDKPSDKLMRLKCSDSLENDFYRFKTQSERERDDDARDRGIENMRGGTTT